MSTFDARGTCLLCGASRARHVQGQCIDAPRTPSVAELVALYDAEEKHQRAQGAKEARRLASELEKLAQELESKKGGAVVVAPSLQSLAAIFQLPLSLAWLDRCKKLATGEWGGGKSDTR